MPVPDADGYRCTGPCVCCPDPPKIPRSLLHLEVAFDAETRVAHRRAPTSRTAAAQPGTRTPGPDRYGASCDPATPLQALSAFTADQRGAEACPHNDCFGFELAAPEPQFRFLVAPKKAARRARR